jgi:hypothetical protein
MFVIDIKICKITKVEEKKYTNLVAMTTETLFCTNKETKVTLD